MCYHHIPQLKNFILSYNIKKEIRIRDFFFLCSHIRLFAQARALFHLCFPESDHLAAWIIGGLNVIFWFYFDYGMKWFYLSLLQNNF